MREQLRRLGTPGPRIIGIDEVSIKKGHTYRIVVSDLVRRRTLWFGGKARSEASMDRFYQWLGPKKSHKIRLAVMELNSFHNWKIIFDGIPDKRKTAHFHVLTFDS